MNSLKIKRVYEIPSEDDGIRILADRLWPRGISKQKAHLDFWFKDIAPSPDLRKWFDHREDQFKEFSAKYKKELQNNEDVKKVLDILKNQNVTLIYAAKSPIVNHAIVLKNFIEHLRKNL